ncbi:MAG: hypothetical protein DRO36_07230 [Candidatus Hecatellales archaeon]|nr:MAG: hypothetical protein DRO36_07230 [Candidatus Hecatellales archaeon]
MPGQLPKIQLRNWQRTILAGLGLFVLAFSLFPAEMKTFLSQGRLTLALVTAIVILAVAAEKGESFLNFCKTAAVAALIFLSGYYLIYPQFQEWRSERRVRKKCQVIEKKVWISPKARKVRAGIDLRVGDEFFIKGLSPIPFNVINETPAGFRYITVKGDKIISGPTKGNPAKFRVRTTYGKDMELVFSPVSRKGVWVKVILVRGAF